MCVFASYPHKMIHVTVFVHDKLANASVGLTSNPTLPPGEGHHGQISELAYISVKPPHDSLHLMMIMIYMAQSASSVRLRCAD